MVYVAQVSLGLIMSQRMALKLLDPLAFLTQVLGLQVCRLSLFQSSALQSDLAVTALYKMGRVCLHIQFPTFGKTKVPKGR